MLNLPILVFGQADTLSKYGITLASSQSSNLSTNGKQSSKTVLSNRMIGGRALNVVTQTQFNGNAPTSVLVNDNYLFLNIIRKNNFYIDFQPLRTKWSCPTCRRKTCFRRGLDRGQDCRRQN